MKDSELLELAKAEIALPENWTQNYFARDILDNPADMHDEAACKFCAMGAVHKSLLRLGGGSNVSMNHFTESSRMFELLRRAIWVRTTNGSIDRFNDNSETTHADILDVFDLAIEMAKQKEKDDQSVPSIS